MSAADAARLDPVCLVHGKRLSEHVCLYCALCFTSLTADECQADEHGQKWDLCAECAPHEFAARAAVGGES